MKATFYLTVEECHTLHAELLRRFGGAEGVRDPGLLESALTRPRSTHYRTLCEQAAALLQSLATSRCFVSGNRRTAFAATAAFLRMNGFHLDVAPEEAERFLVERVVPGKADVAAIARQLEAKLEPAIKEIHGEISARHRKSLDKSGR
jgi:death-on-curing protein